MGIGNLERENGSNGKFLGNPVTILGIYNWQELEILCLIARISADYLGITVDKLHI